MRLRRHAQGLGLLVILLFFWAFILDEPAILFTGTMLIAGLAGQYMLFDARFRQAASSVRLTRTPERLMVRRGSTLRVTTAVTVQVPDHLNVGIRENLPAGVVIQDGETAVTFEPGQDPQTQRVRYRITPVVHGTMPFSGVTLTAHDLFFENDLVLSAESFSGPVLVVQPRGMFEPTSRRAIAETREIEKMSVFSGFGVRSLREYYAGDDLRRIDWKLSAKHDKLFVREYAGVMSLPPLLVVDLPSRGAPYSSDEFNRFVSAVAGMAEYSVRMFQYVSILIISGPNILQYIGDEKDLQRCMTVLREWMHPVERTVHYYRLADRSELRTHVRVLGIGLAETNNPALQRYLGTLQKWFSSTLQHQQPSSFSRQLARVLTPLTVEEIYLYSFFAGDVSHLKQVIRLAKTEKMRVHIRAPGTIDPSLWPAFQSRLGADTVEVFA